MLMSVETNRKKNYYCQPNGEEKEREREKENDTKFFFQSHPIQFCWIWLWRLLLQQCFIYPHLVRPFRIFITIPYHIFFSSHLVAVVRTVCFPHANLSVFLTGNRWGSFFAFYFCSVICCEWSASVLLVLFDHILCMFEGFSSFLFFSFCSVKMVIFALFSYNMKICDSGARLYIFTYWSTLNFDIMRG